MRGAWRTHCYLTPAMKNKHVVLMSIVALQAGVSGCKKATESEPSGSGSPASVGGSGSVAIPVPDGFDFNIVTTSQLDDVLIPGAEVRLREVKSVDEERAAFADKVGQALPPPEKLSDGELWRGTGGWGVAVYRTIEGRRFLCSIPEGSELAAGVSSCKAIFGRGGTLFIPIVIPRDSSSVVSLMGEAVSLWLATEDDATSVEQETFNAKAGLSILRDLPQPNGFAVAYQTFNGGLESEGLIYRAIVRTERGGKDLICRSLSAQNAESVVKALDVCVRLVGA